MNNLVNKVNLIGRLGANPEIRTLENGRKLARIRMATDEVYRDAKGEKKENTQWHTLVAWGDTAERAEKFLAKGKQIAVEGKLSHRDYTDKDGQKRYTTEITVNTFMMLGKKDT